LSQKSRAVSASSCVRAYFSESSTRTRYAWGDAAEEEGERTR
jgi:ornithine carbamoyltransferase